MEKAVMNTLQTQPYVHDQPVTLSLDGVQLVFRAYDGLWMIDRVAEPANERGDEDDEALEETCDEDTDDRVERCDFEGSTAVAHAEVWGMTEEERRSYHDRQLRKLGLPERGRCARLIWSMIEDFDHFAP